MGPLSIVILFSLASFSLATIHGTHQQSDVDARPVYNLGNDCIICGDESASETSCIPCGHSACYECLVRITFDDSIKSQCPQCRAEILSIYTASGSHVVSLDDEAPRSDILRYHALLREISDARAALNEDFVTLKPLYMSVRVPAEVRRLDLLTLLWQIRANIATIGTLKRLSARSSAYATRLKDLQKSQVVLYKARWLHYVREHRERISGIQYDLDEIERGLSPADIVEHSISLREGLGDVWRRRHIII
jgi:hypothetical protein